MAVDSVGFIIKFADDSKAGRVVDSKEDLVAFQDMLNKLENWSQEWQLLFNRSKCKVMHFGKKNPKQQYTMGGHLLEPSKQEKDLGVLIDDSLKPSAQCAKAASKANLVLSQLTRGCTWRDPENLTQLYKVYVLSGHTWNMPSLVGHPGLRLTSVSLKRCSKDLPGKIQGWGT